MKLHFLITTYNRKAGLSKLLQSINKYAKGSYITVIDDCSNYNVNTVTDEYKNIQVIKHKENYGKQYFWKTITQLYQTTKNSDADYFISIQDDNFILKTTIEEAVYYWENIQDDKKIAMNIFTHLNRFGKSAKDVGIQPVPVIFNKVLVLKNMWCDHRFICNKKFFEVLNYHIPEIPLTRWSNHPNRPSGVGGLTSKLLVERGFNIYTAPRTLIGLGDFENSKMNPNMVRPDYSKYK